MYMYILYVHVHVYTHTVVCIIIIIHNMYCMIIITLTVKCRRYGNHHIVCLCLSVCVFAKFWENYKHWWLERATGLLC